MDSSSLSRLELNSLRDRSDRVAPVEERCPFVCISRGKGHQFFWCVGTCVPLFTLAFKSLSFLMRQVLLDNF